MRWGERLLPILSYIEILWAGFTNPELSWWSVTAIRGFVALALLCLWAYVKWGKPGMAGLTVVDWLAFPSVCIGSVTMGVLVDGIDTAYFAGILMVCFMRAFFVPGGLKRVVPMLLFCWATFPGMVLLWAWIDPDIEAQLHDANQIGSAILSSLLLFAGNGLAAICSWVVDALQRHAFLLRKVERYEVQRKLGQGGMGTVYLARHGILKRPTAIKLLSADRPATDELRLRFEKEARHTSLLSHPNTIQIFDFGVTEGGRLYYAMEYIHGIDLARLVEHFGPLPPARAIHFMSQACRSLHHAHQNGIIHRDIKPANCMISGLAGEPDFLKVLDFGLVKVIGQGDKSSKNLSQSMTVVGTPAYMSPEACMGFDVDPRSDVYSLGCLIYFLVTGQPVFGHAAWMKVMMSHISEPPRPPSAVRSDIPPDVDKVILRCLEKMPESRWSSAASFDVALLQCNDAGRWLHRDAHAWWEAHIDDVFPPQDDAETVQMAIEPTVHVPSDIYELATDDGATVADDR
jgi:serine/threonine-protein kinase